jgi:3-hydroxyacyl-CoA dehydrogenase
MDNPPVNALGHALRSGISSALAEAIADGGVAGIVLASSQAAFSAGADVKEFNQAPTFPTLREVIEAMDASPKPIVAAIDGIALGGGYELALACDARAASAKARIGLPEVKLGILPGAGGTQRLPRLIDPAQALKVMSEGEHWSGEKAASLGMVEALVPSDRLVETAVERVRALAGKRMRLRDRKIDPATRQSFEEAAEKALKAHPGEPQIEAVIGSIRAAYDTDFDAALKKERAYFNDLVVDVRSKALRHMFFAERESGRLPGDIDASAAREVTRVGVIGGGTMGGGIAMAFANAGIPVVLVETDAEAGKRAMDRIAGLYAHSVKRGSISEETKAKRLSLIAPAVDYAALADADLVIEAAFEEMDVKREIFGKLAKATKPEAILASNTSYLDIDAIGEASGVPARVVGMHFFSPANVMKLVEIVRGRQSGAEAVATVLKAARALGKTPVVVRNCHGFVGNRMLARRSEQLDRLLLEGATPEEIDKAFTDYGFRMGACAMGDLAGLDISWRMRRATGRTAPVADSLVEAGRIGQKARKGYYRYDEDGRVPRPDPEANAIIEDVSKKHGITRRSFSAEEIQDRLILPMVNEGFRILDEKIAARSGDIDVIWIHGYGFPRWRGGPMFYAETRGLPEIVSRLEEFARATGDASLEPAPMLRQLAAQSGKAA